MKNVFLIACGLFCLISTACADTTTKVGFNGYTWQHLSTEKYSKAMKMALVRGIYEGTFFGATTKEEYHNKLPTTISYSRLANALDEFYADSNNRPIWVVHALEYIKWKIVDLRPSEELEEELEKLRHEHLKLLNR